MTGKAQEIATLNEAVAKAGMPDEVEATAAQGDPPAGTHA